MRRDPESRSALDPPAERLHPRPFEPLGPVPDAPVPLDDREARRRVGESLDPGAPHGGVRDGDAPHPLMVFGRVHPSRVEAPAGRSWEAVASSRYAPGRRESAVPQYDRSTSRRGQGIRADIGSIGGRRLRGRRPDRVCHSASADGGVSTPPSVSASAVATPIRPRARTPNLKASAARTSSTRSLWPRSVLRPRQAPPFDYEIDPPDPVLLSASRAVLGQPRTRGRLRRSSVSSRPATSRAPGVRRSSSGCFRRAAPNRASASRVVRERLRRRRRWQFTGSDDEAEACFLIDPSWRRLCFGAGVPELESPTPTRSTAERSKAKRIRGHRPDRVRTASGSPGLAPVAAPGRR